MAITYKDWLVNVAPGFFRRKWGKAFTQVVGYALDVIAGDATLAVKTKYPTLCPDDAIGYVGSDRLMDRYRAESDTSYRNAVIDARTQWGAAGTIGDATKGMINKILRLGYLNVSIVPFYVATTLTPDPSGPPQTAPYAAWFTAFWIVINPNPFTKRHWGDATLTWGKQVASPVGNPIGTITWGSGANSRDVSELRRAIHRWKPAESICPQVIFRSNSGVNVFSSSNVFIGTRYPSQE